MIVLCATALARPPSLELVGGWAGNADRGYGFVEALPSLARSEDASLVLALGASELYYDYFDGQSADHVDSAGGSIGVGFEYAPGALSLGLSTGFEARRTLRTIGDAEPVPELQLSATLSGNAYWRTGRRASIYANATFTGATAWLWTRVGAIHQVLPAVRTDTAATLWLGLEASGSGNRDTRMLEGGVVAELPVPRWHTSFDVRGGLSAQDTGDGLVNQGTVGAGVYFWY